MNKYQEELDRYHRVANSQSILIDDSKSYQILQEAIDKAQQFDKMNTSVSEASSNLIVYDEKQKRYFHKFTTDGFDTMFQKMCAKLYYFEQFERQFNLNISSKIIFEALTNGIYIDIPNFSCLNIDYLEGNKLFVDIKDKRFICNEVICIYFKDYGKTWWLKKDKSM